jgi:hypothetical protein
MELRAKLEVAVVKGNEVEVETIRKELADYVKLDELRVQ